MITSRDRMFVKYIEEMKFVTYEHLQKVFTKNLSCSYDVVRRRMQVIMNSEFAGYIGVFKFMQTNQKVFYLKSENPKTFTMHKLKTLDYIAELYGMDVEIKYCKINQEFMNREIRSDLFVTYMLDGNIYSDLVEVNLTHTSNLQRYDKLYESMEFEDKYGIKFPRIVVIDDSVLAESTMPKNNIRVIQLDTHLSEFGKVFMRS